MTRSIHFRQYRERAGNPRALAALCLLTSALAFGAPLESSTVAASSRRARAAEAYERALAMRTALETRHARTPESYERVAGAFRQVYRTDPGYAKSPAALAAAAKVYDEMGRRFTSDRYYSKAAEVYELLAAQYPGGSLAIEAMYAAAEICRNDLENPLAARSLYQQFVKIYPNARQAAEAREEIAAIDGELARAARTMRTPSNAAAFSTRAAVHRLTVLPVEGEASRDRDPNPTASGGLQEVRSIRHWIGPDYTRVVIRLDGQVAFNAIHLESPPRLVFDLSGARLSPELARKVFAVENGFLERIRAAQFQPTVTRVVLDVPQIEDYSVFSLPDPFRLVIDIHGARKTMLASAARTAPSETTSGPAVSTIPAAPAPSSAPPERPLSAETAERAAAGSDASGAASRPLGDVGRASDAAIASPAVAAPPDGASPTLTRALGLKVRRIVIDPGHGGHDTGTLGPTGLEEKNVVLDVALRLRKLIERRMGCQVIMTRSTDTFIPLEERTAIANEYGADLFVSIHANSSPDPSARGIEIYYLNFTSDPEALAIAARENATSRESVYQLQSLIKKIALSEKIDESRQFARIVDARLVSTMDDYGRAQPDRGVKKAPFVVLIGANMPSILSEISFLSNPADERLLGQSAYREKIARGLYNGVVRYASALGTLRVAQGSPPRTAPHGAPSF